ncbi:hypothetical protein ACXXDK_09910 [Deinococcus sp. PESE-38]
MGGSGAGVAGFAGVGVGLVARAGLLGDVLREAAALELGTSGASATTSSGACRVSGTAATLA